MFKRIQKLLFLNKSIKKSRKRLETLKKELAWYNEFEIIETYAWFEDTRALGRAIYDEEENLKFLYAEKNKFSFFKKKEMVSA